MAKAKETSEQKKKRTVEIIKLLSKRYPDAHCALNHANAFQLLVATILSAQCTDERVNKVTPTLFNELPEPKDFVKAPIEKIEELIRSTGFYKNKGKNIKGASEKILREFNGEVPKTMDELTSLPGVGRKTANVVLGNAYGIPGLVVDTHVTRLSNRLGLVKTEDAVKIEMELMELVPKKLWTQFAHILIFHGRQTCIARKPQCSECVVNKLCPKIGVIIKS